MLGIARLIASLITFESGFKTILGTVGLIGNHDNIVPVRKDREVVFVLTRHELLYGGKHNPA